MYHVSCLYVYMYLNKVLLLVGWGVDQYVGGLSVDILAQCRLTIDRVSIDRCRLSAFDDLQSIPSISRLIVSRLIDHRHSADTSVDCWFR